MSMILACFPGPAVLAVLLEGCPSLAWALLKKRAYQKLRRTSFRCLNMNEITNIMTVDINNVHVRVIPNIAIKKSK